MKKISVLIFLMCTIFGVFADDAEEIKKMIIQDDIYISKSNFHHVGENYTKDAITIDEDEKTTIQITVLRSVLMLVCGNFSDQNIKNLMIFCIEIDKELSPLEKYESKKKTKALTHDEITVFKNSDEFKGIIKELEKIKIKENLIRSAKLELQTIKFTDIKINDSSAIAVYESDGYADIDSDKIERSITVCKLRKENFQWKIYEERSKKKIR